MSSLLLKGIASTALKGPTSYCKLQSLRSYAKKLVGKVGAAASQKTRLEVEKDPERLINNCCGANIYLDGKDPELKPDSEYPDWLWNLRLDRKAPDLSELDPDDPYYWRRVQRILKVKDAVITKRLEKLKQIQSPLNKK